MGNKRCEARTILQENGVAPLLAHHPDATPQVSKVNPSDTYIAVSLEAVMQL